jgi:hypothetical protein
MADLKCIMCSAHFVEVALKPVFSAAILQKQKKQTAVPKPIGLKTMRWLGNSQ